MALFQASSCSTPWSVFLSTFLHEVLQYPERRNQYGAFVLAANTAVRRGNWALPLIDETAINWGHFTPGGGAAEYVQTPAVVGTWLLMHQNGWGRESGPFL